MPTVRTICTRALRRLGVVDLLNDPSAEEASTALAALNDMMHAWRSKSVDVFHVSYTLDNTFSFFVPPTEIDGRVHNAITNKGTWNASTNSPALSTGVGTIGDTYKVSVAGATTLDGVTSWAAGDYAVFDGVVWRKGEDSQRFEGGVIAMLAVRVADEMGVQPPASLTAASLSAWSSIRSAFITPPLAQFDSGLVRVPSRSQFIE